MTQVPVQPTLKPNQIPMPSDSEHPWGVSPGLQGCGCRNHMFKSDSSPPPVTTICERETGTCLPGKNVISLTMFLYQSLRKMG